LNAGAKVPVKYLKAVTHNTFDYMDKRNFRRETLLGIIAAAQSICRAQVCRWVPATSAEIAAEYRRRMPLPKGAPPLQLDTRGRFTPAPKRARK
jgi:hypothetical protein